MVHTCADQEQKLLSVKQKATTKLAGAQKKARYLLHLLLETGSILF